MKESLRQAVFGILIPTLTLLAGCNSANKHEASNPIQWESVAYHRTTPIEDDEGRYKGTIQQNYTMIVPLHLPQLGFEISRVVFGNRDPEISIRDLLDSLASENRQHLDDIETMEGEVFLNEQILSKVIYEDPQVLSLQVNFVNDENHGPRYTTVCYYNFRIPEGKAFGERELFKDGYEPAISQLITEKIAFQVGDKVVNTDEARPNANFRISEEGVTYCFQEHQLVLDLHAPVEILLTWNELRSQLREDNPVAHLM